MDYENYLLRRQEILDKNSNFVGVVLSDEEKALDVALSALKQEYKSQYDIVPYHMPVLEDEKMWQSRLYDFCKALPKGSDLHVHGSALMPIERFIDFLLTREDVLIDTNSWILYSDGVEMPGRMSLKAAFESGIIDRKELCNKWTILTAKHKANKWSYFENIFEFFEAIDNNLDVLYDYYLWAFKYYVELNIKHVEIHLFLTGEEDFVFDTIKVIRKAYYDVRKQTPDFSVSIIGCGMKMYEVDVEETKKSFKNALKAQALIKDEFDPEDIHDFVLGFDLVNEEDTSRSLSEYAELLLDVKKRYLNFDYFLHSGESLDVNSSNLVDAYLLGARRVGHGINLYRYPQLLKAYADNEICIEACLISNKSLGYVKDLRLHPSLEYLKRGVTIALCSDDPMFFEHETLVDDFFAAIVCWDLNVADIKQLCINSILCSGLDTKSRSALIKSWTKDWKEFVKKF